MAENKKSFLLYSDIIHTVKKLSNEQAGELFKHVLSYVNNETPVTDNIIIELVFEPIRQSLKRDLLKYENICNRNRNNGSKGGRPVNPKEPNKPTGLIGNPKNPNKPDSDSDSDSDSGIEKKNINNKSVLKRQNVLDITSVVLNPENLTNEQLSARQKKIWDEALVSQVWIENNMRSLGLSERSVKEMIKTFLRLEFAADTANRPFSEIKKHFAYWAKKQNQKTA